MPILWREEITEIKDNYFVDPEENSEILWAIAIHQELLLGESIVKMAISFRTFCVHIVNKMSMFIIANGAFDPFLHNPRCIRVSKYVSSLSLVVITLSVRVSCCLGAK